VARLAREHGLENTIERFRAALKL